MNFLNQKGNSLLLLVIIGLLSLATLIFIYQKNAPSQKGKTTTIDDQVTQKTPISSPTINSERYIYDFQKLLISFEKISIKKYSLEIGLPQEMKFIIVNKEQNNDILSQYALFMESQDSTGTEIFDGMLIKINIYPLNQQMISKTYEKQLDQEQKELYKNENLAYKEQINIGSNIYTVINHCCYGGVSKIYYLTSDQYIYEFETFAAGPDKQNFDQVIYKVLEQVHINSK